MEFDLAMTDALLATTRSVRKRLDFDRLVPRELILECLDLAIQAPTGSNRQGWRWMVVDDPELKRSIADIYRATAKAYFADAGAEELAKQDAQVARILESSNWLADNLHKVPAYVIPCIEGRPGPDMPPFGLSAHFGSIFPAVWSFQLALRARGLGSTLTTLHLNGEQEVAQMLGIPDHVMQVALLPVAYTIGTDFRPANRMPASSITSWNHWQAGGD